MGKVVQKDLAKVAAISQWELSKNTRQLLRFLGAANYYRQLIPRFTALAHPLDAVRKTSGPLKWTPTMEKSFSVIRSEINRTIILAYPSDTELYIVGTDASDFRLGAWIGQLQKNGNFRYLSFASRSLSKSDRNYPATKKQLLASVWSLNKFRCDLIARKFTLYTDHRALTFIKNQKTVNTMRNQ